ncbi:MAG TPA: peptidase domain-containing ABC transporter [Chitinophagaceae bacterium]|nr:peptidase domain-containing ABC transporter [Chitinophagaceae bacterium]
MINLFNRFPFISQLNSSDCGLACLKMVAKYYGTVVPYEAVDIGNITIHGISINNLTQLAQKIGFDSFYGKLSHQRITEGIVLPAIVFLEDNHFAVIYKITKNKVWIADPAVGLQLLKKEDFFKKCYRTELEKDEVFLIFLAPTENIYLGENTKSRKLSFIFKYLKKFKYQIALLFSGLLLGGIIELALPYLSKLIIDYSIKGNNINFIYLIVSSQIVLSISKLSIEFMRSWLIIHISSRVSLYIISDFLYKLFKLPLSFFSSKTMGDLSQRISDNNKIESFILDHLLRSVFSIFSLLILSCLLFSLSPISFLIFSIGSIIELMWAGSLLKKINLLKKKEFQVQAQYQSKVYETLSGVQEIRMNNLENLKLREWGSIHKAIFTVNVKRLRLDQVYDSYKIVTHIYVALITLTCGLALSHGKMSAGEMIAIFFILGQINAPFMGIVNLFLHWQNAKTSLERLEEVSKYRNEETSDKKTNIISSSSSIEFKNVFFNYIDRSDSQFILNDINITIPARKTTAIVGVSGSGKTTLLKLLLKFYEPKDGSILIGGQNIEQLSNNKWRDMCGAVLQDSFIFSDTIAYNITFSTDYDIKRLNYTLKMANLYEFVNSLPLKYNTKIGHNGWGLSQGQKQRILIARVIYKNPDYILFDEATNSLDANNELIIMNNLQNFFKNKTVVIVAHRLSTVKNADQIIVIDKGRVTEIDSHESLIKQQGKYFQLIKNQLELGN